MDIKELKIRAMEELTKAKTSVDLDNFQNKYLSRKGEVSNVLRSLKDLSIKQRKKIGPEANQLRQDLETAFKNKKNSIQGVIRSAGQSPFDITAPGKKIARGHLHPITHILRKIEEIFQSMGFKILEGFDIETEYYNFDALNIPKNHPARDAWDTFWLKTKPELLLRTHTSPMQVRFMEKNNPPFRIIVPGRCFRYEATDASHSHTFYQLEGLMVDRCINIANFKAVIEQFLKKLFGNDIEIRIKPSYFPFVEPGFEAEMKDASGKWMEIMGAGMVHPNVFKAASYVPGEWQGFAFGIGIDRIAMLKYKINDIRLLYSNDLKFLNQF
ncbi:phenylalanine--tRNA ligase subunit alpha [Patescibacteria group bacterium]|nr:phenylalanine--tRNA ligase subunit alpha [Patescibacteria group bacterium]MBU4458528.1 phenylalanine--tRNA ligase subunit alpha [Patescibacteria group bacterium]